MFCQVCKQEENEQVSALKIFGCSSTNEHRKCITKLRNHKLHVPFFYPSNGPIVHPITFCVVFFLFCSSGPFFLPSSLFPHLLLFPPPFDGNSARPSLTIISLFRSFLRDARKKIMKAMIMFVCSCVESGVLDTLRSLAPSSPSSFHVD